LRPPNRYIDCVTTKRIRLRVAALVVFGAGALVVSAMIGASSFGFDVPVVVSWGTAIVCLVAGLLLLNASSRERGLDELARLEALTEESHIEAFGEVREAPEISAEAATQQIRVQRIVSTVLIVVGAVCATVWILLVATYDLPRGVGGIFGSLISAGIALRINAMLSTGGATYLRSEAEMADDREP